MRLRVDVMKPYRYVDSAAEVARHYMATWLLPDLATSVPVSYVELSYIFNICSSNVEVFPPLLLIFSSLPPTLQPPRTSRLSVYLNIFVKYFSPHMQGVSPAGGQYILFIGIRTLGLRVTRGHVGTQRPLDRFRVQGFGFGFGFRVSGPSSAG